MVAILTCWIRYVRHIALLTVYLDPQQQQLVVRCLNREAIFIEKEKFRNIDNVFLHPCYCRVFLSGTLWNNMARRKDAGVSGNALRMI